HTGNMSLKVQLTDPAHFLRQAYPGRRYVDAGHPEPAFSQIDNMPPHSTAQVQDETVRRNGFRPFYDRWVGSGGDTITRVVIATPPYHFPPGSLVWLRHVCHPFESCILFDYDTRSKLRAVLNRQIVESLESVGRGIVRDRPIAPRVLTARLQ